MKSLLFKIFVLSCILFFSISSNAQWNAGSVPDSLKKYTLLVMKADQGMMQKLYNKKLKAALEKNYDGPFELVGKEDLETDAYADLTKYRYTVDVEIISTRQVVTQTSYSSSSRTVATVDLFFKDRLNNQRLPNTGILSATYITSLRNLGLYLSRNQK